MKKLNNWVRRNLTGFLMATSSVEKSSLGQQSVELEGNVSQEQRVNQGTLADSLVNGEITQEVKDLRWRMYKILDASNKMIVTSLSVDEEGYHTVDVEKPNNIGQKVLLNKIKVDEHDYYPLELVVDNKDITISTSDVMNIDGMVEYDLDQRKDNLSKIDESSTSTLGEIKNDMFHSAIKNDRHITILRSIRPKFEIEKYTKKLNVRKISETEKLLEFYVSIYPDEYDKTSQLFLSELKRGIKTPRTSSLFDIDEVSFISYRTVGVNDFHEFKYKVETFDKVIEYNGHYVIKFKCDVTVNGEYLLEKFREEELEEKYKNKESKQ